MINLKEKLKSGDKKMILAVLAVFLVFAYLDFNFIIQAQIKSVKNVSPKVTKLRQDLDKLNKDLASMNSMGKQMEVQKKRVAKAKRVISEEQVAAILQEISGLANKNEIKILQLTPAKDTGKQEAAPAAVAAKFLPFSITLELSSDYHRLGKFVNELENGEVFLALQDLTIEPQKPDYLKQKVRLVLRTYVKK